MSTPPSLWRNRNFVLFWFGQTISIAGTTVTGVVLPILIFQLTGSALQTSLLASLNVLPYLIFGLFAGTAADRVDRKRLMVTCDIVNTALLASIPLAATLNVLTIPHIYIVAALSATAFVWFDAANFGALPTLVGRDRLLDANSALWSASTLVSILGPSVGGVLAAVIGPANTLTLDSASYAVSAFSLLLITRALNTTRTAQAVTESFLQRTGADIREGFKFLWGHQLVRTLTLLGFGVSFTGGAVISLLVVYAVRALGLPQDDARIGLLFTASAIGALLASVLLPPLVRRFPVGRITLIGLLANPIMLVGIVVAPDFWFGLIAVLVWEFCHSLIIINGISLRQMVTPEHLQGRVNVTARMISWGGSPFGALVGGALAEFFEIRLTYLLVAAGVLISAVLGWFSPLGAQAKPEEVRPEAV